MKIVGVVVGLLAVGSASAAPSTISPRNTPFTWGSTKIRGVNLGGWLVLEPWITPTIFTHPSAVGIVDEFTLGASYGIAALPDLRHHWSTFVTKSDFQAIAAVGLNTVRIPIGFWAFDTFNTPYLSGQAPYLEKAVRWARETGLKVIIDLHGAPGSQNGFDNSGQQRDTPGWGTGATVQQTLQVLHKIQSKYAALEYQDVVIGIEILNEPMGPVVDKTILRQFYRDGFAQTRSVSPSTTVVLSDAFFRPREWNGFLTPQDSGAQNVALDHHEYQIFDMGQITWSHAQHISGVCDGAEAYSGADKWTFVGEWTGAMTDCAHWVNGVGRGARYDGTYLTTTAIGSCGHASSEISSWSPELRDVTRRYIEAQIAVFEAKTQGWVFWTWKTERSPEWDMQRLVTAGLFPTHLAEVGGRGLIC
ncbi:glycoside hydrolase family 5 protein [Patellaria atrata CBS 101060]|uniref:glucan 1,3-beta-glucosidase n=1 Tax=Patellaria atrata CBS 101060 TaxID=1346257 RepID=A0A9P4VT87_9PEZI|nr:glycoside hydrolase family 5 protein [Patellaria atrata CBS 101060]